MSQRDLFRDFLTQSGHSAKFYRASFYDKQARIDTVKQAAQKTIKPVVFSELERLNLGASEAVDNALNKLRTGKAAVVVTGQQLGMLGGPLLTLYKILSAVKLANFLEEESGIKVVPLFWLQSEDHDFNEIKTAKFYGPEGDLVELSLPNNLSGIGDSVGAISLNDQAAADVRGFLEGVESSFPEIKKQLVEIYSSGATLSQVMIRTLRLALPDLGFLVFDSLSAPVKAENKDFIASAFLRTNSISSLLQAREKELLDWGYQSQVKLRPRSPLFFVSSGRVRQRLEETGEGVWSSESFSLTKEELYKLLDSDPGRFTTSALIRPVFQDTIFPSAAYVGGSAEIAYWAQLKGLYEFFNCLQPLVVPRARVLLLDNASRRNIEKLNVTLSDLGKSPEAFVSDRLSGTKFDSHSIFEPLEVLLDKNLGSIAEKVVEVDPGLKGALETTREAMTVNLSRFKNKYERALVSKEQILVGQFNKVKNYLTPNGVAQEREVAFVYFLLKYGPDFVNKVIENVDLFCADEYSLLQL